MSTLRLLADDLTGALDTSAELVPLVGPIEVFWTARPPYDLPPCAALDTGSREGDEVSATAAVAAACAGMHGTAIAFKKVDSLFRGHTLAELAACVQAGGWRHVVLAPAFPFQGRITRDGRQMAAMDGRWRPVGPDLLATLAGTGLRVQQGRAGRPPEPGVSIFDAESQAELDAIVAGAHGVDDVLWCGTGGLAQALASGQPQPGLPAISRPILGLFGSDQAVTTAQLAACTPHWHRHDAGSVAAVRTIGAAHDRHGIAMLSLDLPPGLSRFDAACRIGAEFASLVQHLPPPGTLVVAGGETLRSLCVSLEARSLLVRGRLVPGVPVSTMRGGRWDGVTVLSKSGAFGPPGLWRDLLPFPPPPVLERITP